MCKGVEVLTLPTKVLREVIARELRGLAGLRADLGTIGVHDTNHFTHSTPIRSKTAQTTRYKSAHDNFSTPSEVREVALTVRGAGGAGGAGGLPSDIVAVLDIIEPHLHHLHGMPGRGEGSEDGGSEYAEEGDMNSAPAHFNNAF